MKRKQIGILGSTGHIAKGLAENLSKDHELHLYSRNADTPLELYQYADLDVLINCIGPREKLWTDPYRIFTITEEWDGKCIDYCMAHPDALYISFSSGAVFGGRFDNPVDEKTPICHAPCSLPSAFYGIAKLNSEAKHRALKNLNIVDIRVFSYFSRYLPPDSRCLMAEIIACIEEGRELMTSPEDFSRDYIHPKDLAQLIERVMEVHDLNAAFDAYSLFPCAKFEILDFFREQYGLRYRVDPEFRDTSPTGPKLNYYSVNMAAQEIGYYPQYSAMDAIKEEAGKIIQSSKFKIQNEGQI